MEVLMDLDRI